MLEKAALSKIFPKIKISRVGFIGGGVMGTAIADGLLKTKVIDSNSLIFFCERNRYRQKQLAEKFQKHKVTGDVKDVRDSDCIFLCVKPKDSKGALKSLSKTLRKEQIVVSTMAGVKIDQIQELLPNHPIIRAMPNAPVSVNQMACGFSCGKFVTEDQKIAIDFLLNQIGVAYNVEEKLMKAVTGVSGSSPAYVFIMIEALSDAGVKQGLPRHISTKLAAKAVLGAAQMCLETKKHPGELKDMIASPAGTTIEGLASLERSGFRGTVIDAVTDCCNRVDEMEKNK